MITATIALEFEIAKRLMNFKGKCSNLHGYRQKIEARIKGALDENGLLLDFYEIKKLLRNWLDENWDHNVLLNKADKDLGSAIEKITGQKIFYFEGEPTAELMAQHLLANVMPGLLKQFPGAKCDLVRLYDNDEAWVEAN